jgi:hypothetical protein
VRPENSLDPGASTLPIDDYLLEIASIDKTCNGDDAADKYV